MKTRGGLWGASRGPPAPLTQAKKTRKLFKRPRRANAHCTPSIWHARVLELWACLRRTTHAYGNGFDAGPPSGRAVAPEFLQVLRLLVVFLRLPGGVPNLPATFQGLRSGGGASVNRNFLLAGFSGSRVGRHRRHVVVVAVVVLPASPLSSQFVASPSPSPPPLSSSSSSS